MTEGRFFGGIRPAALAAVVLVGVLLLATSACHWRENGSNEARTNLPEAVAAGTAADSFHAVQVLTGESQGVDVSGRTDIYYQAPDSVRSVSDRRSGPFLEAILIGNQAWVRDAAGWTVADPVSVRSLILSPLLALEHLPQAAGVQPVGDGPETMGEPTIRYRLELPDFGDVMIAQLGALAQDPAYATVVATLQETYQDVSAEIEVTVGQQSRRIYSLTMTQRGPNQDLVNHTTFEYGNPVIIQPPA